MLSMIEPLVITHFLNHCNFPNPNGLEKWENEISVPQCGEERGDKILIRSKRDNIQDHQTIVLSYSSFCSFGQQ